MDITYQYTMKRERFGRQPLFCEQGPVMCDTIVASVPEQRNYILRNPVHQNTQNTPILSENHLNTERAEFTSSGANHAEGGWPKDVNVLDPEMTQRYRRKIEKEDNYINCLMNMAPGIDHYVLQNNAIDMYRSYYTEMVPLPTLERSACRTVNVYRDGAAGGEGATPRPVRSICWQPDGGQRFAVTYALVNFNRLSHAPLACYIWDLEKATSPEMTLEPPCPMLALVFNQRDPTSLAGGLLSGQVCLWDRRLGGTPVGTSAPHATHRDLVNNVLYINAKSGQEFFSTGPDGACKWWDARDLTHPTDEMIIDVVTSSLETQTMAHAHGVCSLEFEPTMPTRFMVGTEDGLVIAGNRKGKTPIEKLPVKFNAHIGPVCSVERNPNFLKNFLTVGDWTARVWSEECRESAVLCSPPYRHTITHGIWSPTRLSLMLLAQGNGMVALWDLLRRQHEPALAVQVCDEPLLRLRAHEAGSLVACGSQKGYIYMVEMSSSLSQSEKNDKALMTAMLERESKRERILEARTREIRLKLRQAEESSPAASASELEVLDERDLADVGAEYAALVNKELATML